MLEINKPEVSLLRAQRIVHEFKSSEMSQALFCESRNLSIETLQSYFSRITMPEVKPKDTHAMSTTGFVELKVCDSPPSFDEAPSELTISFPDLCCEIRIPDSIDTKNLKSVIEVLSSCCT